MKPRKKLYFMECHVAGCQYHDTNEVWDKLSIGTELVLEHDPENRYDGDAVAIIYRDPEDDEEYILGYVPRSENKTIATFLKMGYSDIFECRLAKKDAEKHYEEQLHVNIMVKRNKAARDINE